MLETGYEGVKKDVGCLSQLLEGLVGQSVIVV